jgi:hypothetical protein
MVSRKKAKGKARRAAKAKAAKAMEDEAVAAANQLLEDGQLPMRSLNLKRDALMMNYGVAKCHHGLAPSYHRHRQQSRGELLSTSNNLKNCEVFLQTFVNEFDGSAGNFLAAYHATKEKYAEVWNDPGKTKFVVSYLLTCGTSKILAGHVQIASKYAALANYFEQYMEFNFLKLGHA